MQAFDQCDVDGSGRIDIKELHIGLLILYDKINQVLPIHYPVPSKYQVVERGNHEIAQKCNAPGKADTFHPDVNFHEARLLQS